MLSSFFIGVGAIGNLLGATPLALSVELIGWRWSMAGISLITASSAIAAFRDAARPRADRGGETVGAG